MKAAKKTVMIIALLLAAVLLFAVVSYLFLKPVYYRFFYFGDRIAGTVCVRIDGKKYDLEADDVSVICNDEETKVGFRNDADAATVSVHGGEYGPYRLMLHIDGLDFPLEAVIYQYNWYNVSRFDLDISIDRAAETITFSSTAQVLSEIGETVKEDHSTTTGFSDGKHVHYIVTV